MTPCTYCGKDICWILVRGKNRPFNDLTGSSIHTCHEFKNGKSSLSLRVTDLEDAVEGLKNLNSKIISKISKLEKRGF